MPPSSESPFDRRRTVEQLRHETFLICPDNDAEAHLILLLAEKAGIKTLRSTQRHGAKLELEPQVIDQCLSSEKPSIWIVEMPGPETEAQLHVQGFSVSVIDHHEYRGLNRVIDPNTGRRQPSSLEQFLKKAQITDEELRQWGFDPKVIYGIGIMDDQYVQGLRKTGYSQTEIAEVLELNQHFSEEINPDLATVRAVGAEAWARKKAFGPYILIESDAPQDIRGAISFLSIRENMDTQPCIISSSSGKKIYVQNVAPAVTEFLMKQINGRTFTFGVGRCWGVDNTDQAVWVTFDEVMSAVKAAPSPYDQENTPIS